MTLILQEILGNLAVLFKERGYPDSVVNTVLKRLIGGNH